MLKNIGNKKTFLGFTLIELLITVTIIAVLTTIGARVYRQNLENSIDNKRVKDLESFKQSLEIYRQYNRAYPATLGELTPQFLDTLPADPSTSNGWSYQYKPLPTGCTSTNKDCSKYVICAKTEGTQTYGKPTDCTSLTCGGTVGDCNYGVASVEYGSPFLQPSPTPGT
jgi:general secretion pathway protein G